MNDFKNLKVRKLKGVPYKLLLLGWEPIGLFDKGQYFDKTNFTEEHHLASAKFHAETMKERVESMV